MEDQLPKSNILNKIKNKKILIIAGAIILVLVVTLLILFASQRSSNPDEVNIAPTAESLENPLNIQVSLGFSATQIEVQPGEPFTLDLNLQTFKDEGISGGTIVLIYDPYMISDVEVTPIFDPTGLVPGAIFEEVKYNPGNIVISFQLPDGTSPITGSGRIAELTLTAQTGPKGETMTSLTYDFERSRIYNLSNGTETELKPSKSDLDITLNQSPIAPDAQDRLNLQNQLIQQ